MNFELIPKPKQIIEFPTGRILPDEQPEVIEAPKDPMYEEIDALLGEGVSVAKILQAIEKSDASNKEELKQYALKSP